MKSNEPNKLTLNGNRFAFIVIGIVAAMLLTGVQASAQQASISLLNSDIALCNRQNTEWNLTKTNDATNQPVSSGTAVTWTVTATKGTTGPKTICAFGYVEVKNTGSAPATIGNIVVNLQRQRLIGTQQKWVSASADVATAYNGIGGGDAATQANIVPGGSQETPSWNVSWNSPATYVITGTGPSQYGTFKENGGSGALEFTDADTNTIWAITPQQTIGIGGTVKLYFTAAFNNTVLGIPDGTSLRTEAIVTFGNAGTRGSGGASGTNIDIDGSGATDLPNEANVRSVPTRITKTLPALQDCNGTVTLDESFGSTSLASYTTPVASIGLPVSISASTSFTVSSTVSGTGSVTNTATLKGTDTVVTIVIGVDSVTGLPITKDFPCCTGTNLEAASTVNIEVVGFLVGDYCSYSKGGYHGTGTPGQIFDNNFSAIFLTGLTIGTNDGLGPLHHALWTAAAPGPANLKVYLLGGGGSGALTADTTNATSTSGGQLPKQTAALALNVAFNDAGVIVGATLTPLFGDLVLTNTSTSLDGVTVRNILGAANIALGGGGLPTGYSFGALNNLITNLNEAFDNCAVSGFAQGYLTK